MTNLAARSSPARTVGMLLVAATLATGCDDRDSIAERRAPKGVEVILDDHDHASHADATDAFADGVPGVAWTAPAGWRRVPSDNPTRLAVFTIDGVPDAEVVVTRFPGTVGGELANVNRWRGQIGLGAVDGATLAQHVEREAIPGYSVYVVSATNNGAALVAAGLEEAARGRTWFVKATGPEAAVDRLREDVRAFVRSFRALPEGE